MRREERRERGMEGKREGGMQEGEARREGWRIGRRRKREMEGEGGREKWREKEEGMEGG